VTEELVSNLVTQGVVDPAEVIEIDEKGRDQPLAATGLFQLISQPFLVRQSVGQAGQTVVVGELPDLLQHARVGERDRGLVGQAPHLVPVFLRRVQLIPFPQGDDTGQLPLVGER
jgi:hypothetical protein